jgi:preprotein translocase subunit SecB
VAAICGRARFDWLFYYKDFFMSEANDQISAQANHQLDNQSGNPPSFTIQRIYMKDASLEQPNAPGIFLEAEVPPSVGVEVNILAEKLIDGYYEIVITGTVTTKASDKVVFLVEVKQAGIFDIRNFPSEQVDPLLYVACPKILFPYLRSNISDLVTRAGFAALHLAELNFQALYEERCAELAASSNAMNGNGATAAMTH